MITDKRITLFDGHLDKQYGKIGTESREKFQEEFETFKIGVLIQEARKNNILHKNNLRKKLEQQKNIFQELKIMQVISVFQL